MKKKWYATYFHDERRVVNFLNRYGLRPSQVKICLEVGAYEKMEFTSPTVVSRQLHYEVFYFSDKELE